MDFDDYLNKMNVDSFAGYSPFIGVVEDNSDPLTLGRVRARCFNYHPEDRTLVQTEHLPWAIVAQPTNSSSISGIGSFAVLEVGTWVMGYFADGKTAQYPIVTHTLPGIHRPNPPGVPGGASAGFLDPSDPSSGAGDYSGTTDPTRPYHNEVIETPAGTDPVGDGPIMAPDPNSSDFGQGASLASGAADINLTSKDIPKWDSLGLKTYSWKAAPDGYACKDGKGSLLFHYPTALAFEKLTRDFGKGKLYLNSAYRTKAYNASVGGARASQHMVGRALDVSKSSIGSSQEELLKFAKLAVKNGFVGFGLYPTFMHIDTGTGRTWNGAKAAWFVNGIKEAGWYQGKKGLSGIAVNPGASSNTADPTNSSGSPDDRTGGLNSTGSSTEAAMRQSMTAHGYTPEQQAAVLSSAYNESTFNPNAVGDNGSSYGLFQFHGDRLTGLQQYSAANGKDYRTVDAQMDYFYHEQGSRQSGTMLRNASSTYEANQAMAQYEVYQGYNNPNSGEFQQRLNDTNSFNTGNKPAGATSASKGFVDPSNSLPYPSYRGNPSTHVNARGFNSNINQPGILAKDAGRETGYPAAGDTGTFGEPELATAPQYPYNNVTSTKAGHLFELDSTPGAERINLEHPSGSSVEMFADGRFVERSKGNAFRLDSGDSFHTIGGKFFMTSVNDMALRSTADMNLQSDGSFSVYIGHDGIISVSGDAVINARGDVKIKASGKLVIESAGDIDILANGSMNLEAKEKLTIKGKSVSLESSESMTLKSKTLSSASSGHTTMKADTVYLDDIVRMAEGGAKDVDGIPGADTADLGTPPAPKVVEKDNLKSSTNLPKATTTEDASDHYSREHMNNK